jgi:hypothetical protein
MNGMESGSILCALCQGINIESLAQSSGYRHLGLGKLRRSRDTCQMCDLLCIVIEDPSCQLAYDGKSDVSEIWNDTWSLNLQLAEGIRPSLSVAAYSPSNRRYSVLEVDTDLDDPAILVGLRPLSPLASSTKSFESFATARKWIGDCMAGHPHVRGITSGKIGVQQSGERHVDSNDRPHRLVHVQSRGSGLLLKLTDAASIAQAYVTLSHCVRKPIFLHGIKFIDL